jgi:predicted nucleic acid-binding protein
LKGKHHVVTRLSDYWIQLSRLMSTNLLILDLDEARIMRAQGLREKHGLLTTDATILAAMVELGIDRLATNDSDFVVVPNIHVYHPTDLP